MEQISKCDDVDDNVEVKDFLPHFETACQFGVDTHDVIRRFQDDITNAEPNQWLLCTARLNRVQSESKPDETFLRLFRCGQNLAKARSRLYETLHNIANPEMGDVVARNLAQLLISENSDVIFARNDLGETIVHQFARENKVEAMRYLIQELKDTGRLSEALVQTQNEGTTLMQLATSEGHDECMKLLIIEGQVLTSNLPIGHSFLSYALEQDRHDLVSFILQQQPDLVSRDAQALVTIVRKDARKAWEEAVNILREANPNEPFHPESNVLREAVKTLNDFMVAEIMALQPSLAVKEWEENGENLSLLHLIGRTSVDTSETKANKQRIRKHLLPEFINTYNVGTLKQKFQEANDKSLALVLTPLGENKKQDFFEFARLLCGENGKNDGELWTKREFETDLRLVRLPDLHEIAKQPSTNQRYWETGQELQKNYSEAVSGIFSWLKEKNVTSIYKVMVRDSFEFPVPEHTIEKALEGLKIQYLDWKRPDMSIDALATVGKYSLSRLHLYSSGNRAVLRHWLGSEGFRTLPKQNLDENSKTKINHIVQNARTGMTLEEKGRSLTISQPNFLEWKTTYPSSNGSQTDTEHIFCPPISYATYEKFREQYLSFFADNAELIPPVRVAIVDNGVDEYALGKEVKEGHSFIDHEDDYESDYGLVSDPHGTQMAICVNHFNPQGEIYAAKVGIGKRDFTIERVRRAISWAVTKEVDVISLSIIFDERSSELQALKDEIVKATKEANILVFYSTGNADASEGYSPLNCYGAFSVSTTDAYHADYQQPRDKPPDYVIKAPKVTMKDIPYRDFDPKSLVGEGTSVATSTLAGFASMILTCGKFANGGWISSRRAFVTSRLRAERGTVSLGDGESWGGREVPKKFAQPQDFETFLNKYFKKDSA